MFAIPALWKRLFFVWLAAFSLSLQSITFADLIAVSGAHGPGSTRVESILYRVNETTGIATKIGNGTGVNHLSGLAIHPVTGVLYAIDNVDFVGGSLYTIDLTTGLASVIGATQATISDISFRPNGTLYGWLELGSLTAFSGSNDLLVTIDTASAAVTPVSTIPLGSSRTGLAFASDDTLYLKSGGQEKLRQLNPNDGAVIGEIVTSINPISTLAIGSNGQGFTVVSYSPNGSSLESIDLQTGALTQIAFFTDPNDLDGNGNPNPISIRALAYVQAVPEPSTFILVAIAGGVWIVNQQRKRRSLSQVDRRTT